MMQTLILPDSRKGKGIIRYRPAWTIALSCCLKDVADPCWSKISTRGIPFGMVWQCRAGIWSRALKDLAYQRPWRTASGSNLDIKRDNTVAAHDEVKNSLCEACFEPVENIAAIAEAAATCCFYASIWCVQACEPCIPKHKEFTGTAFSMYSFVLHIAFWYRLEWIAVARPSPL